ncbi:MAG TPA: DUF6471 domain-containing protein [Chitinophagales bacterium]|nr:DUF6471 domain-containing protein [Chitinophagales bacterium]HMW93486.1 DUF6471 domain-containing protein [Chitinophagales bacterium]HMZ92891.1 DUF6471 domain-containing protein [Chitinophagales bacterium]HNG25920.1 DUF6471 domain-containing protein [Chitinophagales bacterium]
MNKIEWEKEVKGILKSELARRGMTYEELCEKLEAIEVSEKPENINNKINRGTFSAIFLIQCLKAIGCENLKISG